MELQLSITYMILFTGFFSINETVQSWLFYPILKEHNVVFGEEIQIQNLNNFNIEVITIKSNSYNSTNKLF